MPISNNDFEQNLVYAAIQDDEKLKEYIRGLAWKVMRQSEYLLDHGHVNVKVQVMKNIMPAITRALTNQAEDEKYTKMRAEFEGMLRDLLPNSIPIDEPLDDDD